jgi:hypothetical protein
MSLTAGTMTFSATSPSVLLDYSGTAGAAATVSLRVYQAPDVNGVAGAYVAISVGGLDDPLVAYDTQVDGTTPAWFKIQVTDGFEIVYSNEKRFPVLQNIFERVALDLVDTLEDIDADTYGFAPLVRRRGKACKPTSKNTASDGTAYEVELELQLNRIEQQQPTEFGKSFYVMHMTLVGFISQSDESETSIDTLYSDVYTAVTIALMADAQRSALAIDTTVGDMLDQISIDGAYEAMTVDLQVQIRTDQFNPMSL